MTVCIAAISKDNFVFAIADRLVTAGDMEFEPSQPKIFALTSSIFLMTSDDDASLTAEILSATRHDLNDMIVASPNRWLEVPEVVDVFVKNINTAKRKRAERDILFPLGLTTETFISRQREMDPNFVTAISEQIINYALPRSSNIICGHDPWGPHIYVVHNNDSGCYDDIGFASVGIGASHANSQFMIHRHSRLSPTEETIFLTYLAKRRSEVAPGVGLGSDTLLISGLGVSNVWNDALVSKLEKEYDKMIKNERRVQQKSKEEIGEYVRTLQTRPPETTTANQIPVQQDGGKIGSSTDSISEEGTEIPSPATKLN